MGKEWATCTQKFFGKLEIRYGILSFFLGVLYFSENACIITTIESR